ncbi:hypothetical protein Chor_005244 [Crotalus horridus]
MAMAPGPAWMPRRTGAHRSLEKAFQGLTKLQPLVCQPQMALRNSPPHLPSLLPQIYQHLKLIREHYGAGLAQLWESEFFRIFLLNLLEKIKQATQLFKRGKDKEEIFQEGSAASHMLAELQAVFPNREDQGSTYQLSKQEAQVFWRCTWRERYIFRLSCTRLGQWAIGYVTADGDILQTIPQNKSLFQALVDGQKEGFQVESTFQLCKICAENNKDVQIRPCGHLLCRECLKSWQLSKSPTCPFCRQTIWGHEEVEVSPYSSQEGSPTAKDESDEGDLEDVDMVLQQLMLMRQTQGVSVR